jgi:very-short-patch-repair endonuclease
VQLGLTVLRIPAEFVRDNLEAVLWDIAAAAGQAANPKAP